MNILIQYHTKYIIIPSFQTKTFIHLQGKYQQTIYMCLCIIPELNCLIKRNFTNSYYNVINNTQLATMNVGKNQNYHNMSSQDLMSSQDHI